RLVPRVPVLTENESIEFTEEDRLGDGALKPDLIEGVTGICVPFLGDDADETRCLGCSGKRLLRAETDQMRQFLERENEFCQISLGEHLAGGVLQQKGLLLGHAK